jgi:hypothetical protein
MIEPLHAVARLVSINGTEAPVQKLIEIDIRDLSLGGMKMEATLDLPIDFKIIIRTSFDFEQQHFDAEGLIVRKKLMGNDLIEYGIKFIKISRLEEQQLVRCLNQYKIKHVKTKKSQIDLRKQKGVGTLIKMMEAIDTPAYLITAQRVIVATNRVAQSQGAHLGERCYQTLYQNKKICPFCRIEEASQVEDVLTTEAVVLNERHSLHWIYLENGLTLHYLRKI